MFVLELLGTISLRGDTDPVPVAAQQKRSLGLLAILALSGSRGISRDRIEAFLWPESETSRARHGLDQLVYAARRALGADAILATGRELRLNPAIVRADVLDFEAAIAANAWAAAADAYKGPLLDGFTFADSRELESWIDAHRLRLLHEYQRALEHLATTSPDADDAQAIGWWRKLAISDPLSAAYTKKLMLALARAGDRAGAVKHARLHQQLVRQQLEMEPDAEIEALAATLTRPGVAEHESAGARRAAAGSAPSPSIVSWPLATDASLTPARTVEPKRAARYSPVRVAWALSMAVLVAVLIGAVTMESRQRRDRRVSADAARRPATSVTPARAAYLHGLDAWRDGSRAGLDTSVVYFHRATALDSGYAEAWAALADAYVMLGYFGYEPGDATFPRARAAAQKSLTLDSTLASALPALAYALTWERDFPAADVQFRKAVAHDPTSGLMQATALDPTDALSHQWYPVLLALLGERPGDTVARQRVVDPTPFSAGVPLIELTFTKWITSYPAMSGFTSYGPSTMHGAILSRIDDGTYTHMIARYEIDDPNGTHSFKSVVQGKADNRTGLYELTGIVSWGWMTGAHVRANFQRVSPCKFGHHDVCFSGTIQLQRG